MRFDDVLALQSAKEVPTKAVARRAKAPRSRTDPMLEVAHDAQTCFTAAADRGRERLHRDQAEALQRLQAEEKGALNEVENQQAAHL